MDSKNVRQLAQQAADIEFGDFGTLGGNVAPMLTERVLGLDRADRALFTDLYLSYLRQRLLSPDFSEDTPYRTTQAHFNPRE